MTFALADGSGRVIGSRIRPHGKDLRRRRRARIGTASFPGCMGRGIMPEVAADCCVRLPDLGAGGICVPIRENGRPGGVIEEVWIHLRFTGHVPTFSRGPTCFTHDRSSGERRACHGIAYSVPRRYGEAELVKPIASSAGWRGEREEESGSAGGGRGLHDAPPCCSAMSPEGSLPLRR